MPLSTPVAPPALGAVRQRRITNRWLASRLGCSEDWVYKVLTGQAKAPTRFRSGLAEILGLPEDELFQPEATDE